MNDERRFGPIEDFPQHFHGVESHYPTVWERIVIELCREVAECRNALYADNHWPADQTAEQVYAEILQRIKDNDDVTT